MPNENIFDYIAKLPSQLISGITGTQDSVEQQQTQKLLDKMKTYEEKNYKSIYLAGGCFWGVEAYMERIAGVVDAISGYANGNTQNPTYKDVLYKNTGHAETVLVYYDPVQVSLENLLFRFFAIIDPLSFNKQGNDIGSQYRTGIYYSAPKDEEVIKQVVAVEQKKYDKPIVVEILPLQNFTLAEDYHQDYLQKNPDGYCHIDLRKASRPIENVSIDPAKYSVPDKETLKKKLSPLQYSVACEHGTERPFESPYNNNKKSGIYVDIVTGEPLFASYDKFDSGSGWPSFTKPIDKEVIQKKADNSFGMQRTEVLSRVGTTHLGHVFPDGPKEKGGLRYCINGASLRFISLEEMEKSGYGYLLPLFNK